MVQDLQVGFQVSERRACAVVGISRSSNRYRSTAQDQTALRMRLRDLAAARVRYGYRRLHVLLRREGWPVNHKRIYRLAPAGRACLAAEIPPETDQRCSSHAKPSTTAK